MRFKLWLRSTESTSVIPINYSYPLSAAIYKILSRADVQYTSFLHEKGYGKGFKLFSFSQLSCTFRVAGDRMVIIQPDLSFVITFHLPKAAEIFVRGLFESVSLDIADKRSKAIFQVQRVESISDSMQQYGEHEIVQIGMKPISPIVVGIPDEKGIYDFLSPDHAHFSRALIHNWRSKIAVCQDEATARDAILIIQAIKRPSPPKSRLITIKADTAAQSKIRGWVNFELRATAEKRFLELLFNAGAGIYNAQGMGCVEYVSIS